MLWSAGNPLVPRTFFFWSSVNWRRPRHQWWRWCCRAHRHSRCSGISHHPISLRGMERLLCFRYCYCFRADPRISPKLWPPIFPTHKRCKVIKSIYDLDWFGTHGTPLGKAVEQKLCPLQLRVYNYPSVTQPNKIFSREASHQPFCCNSWALPLKCQVAPVAPFIFWNRRWCIQKLVN